MDMNDIRAGVTLLSLLMFLGIVAWAFSKRNKTTFDAMAELPLSDEALGQASISQGGHHE